MYKIKEDQEDRTLTLENPNPFPLKWWLICDDGEELLLKFLPTSGVLGSEKTCTLKYQL